MTLPTWWRLASDQLIYCTGIIMYCKVENLVPNDLIIGIIDTVTTVHCSWLSRIRSY